MRLSISHFCFILVILLISFTRLSAQTFNYRTKSAFKEDCLVTFGVTTNIHISYILVEITSNTMSFYSDPQMVITTKDGTLLTLTGSKAKDSQYNYSVISGNLILPASKNNTMAIFEIRNNQFDLLKNGVSKINLQMVPTNLEITNKSVGKKLYKLYQKDVKKWDNFNLNHYGSEAKIKGTGL